MKRNNLPVATEEGSNTWSHKAPVSIEPEVFARFAALIYRQTGIKLGPRKQALVCARVGKRMRIVGCRDFREYYDFVQSDRTSSELRALIDAISTNVTGFYREHEHFDFMKTQILKWQKEGQTRFRIWSAACSTGEEPYTMAMVLQGALGNRHDAKILATDISTQALSIAREGVYEEGRMGDVPGELVGRHFDRVDGGRTYRIRENVKAMIRFRRLNLAAPPFPLRGPLDIVFCRNVMIYFDNELRRRLLAELFRLIKPGGYLIVGRAEGLSGMLSRFEGVEPSVYVRPSIA